MNFTFKKLSAFLSRNHQQVGIFVVFVIVALGVLLAVKFQVRFLPEHINTNTELGITLKFRATDHIQGGAILPNDLSYNPSADYFPQEDPPERLSRESNGNIINIPSIQAEIDYK